MKKISKVPYKGDFGGKLGNKISDFASEEERSFEKKHLKAYLRSRSVFQYGWETTKEGYRIPKNHLVKYIKKEENA